MSEMMVRKQIYLPRKQNLLLKQLAKRRGISEAEVIRQALAREVEQVTPVIYDSVVAWERILHFVSERLSTLVEKGPPVHWNREELYEERERRWNRHHEEK
ncbi:MAG: ribbon-helix-helix domain-containing protein [Chloroflexi bacterium]|nr:ribbon-helix-helix domain-containing protein [Chloroflexota bacterium]